VQNAQISIDNIQKTVADYYKIRITDMHSKKRSRAVGDPADRDGARKELTQLSLRRSAATRGPRPHHGPARLPHHRGTARAHSEINHDVTFLLQVLRN